MPSPRPLLTAVFLCLASCGPSDLDVPLDEVPGLASDDQALTANRAIFTDSLAAGWSDWSWGTTRDFTNTSPVVAGLRSIRVSYGSPNGGLYLRYNAGLSTQGYSHLRFSAQRGSPAGNFRVALVNPSGTAFAVVSLSAVGGQPLEGQWRAYRIPLSQLAGLNRTVYGIFFLGLDAPSTLYIDRLALVADGLTAPPPASGPKSLNVAPVLWPGPLSDHEATSKVRATPENRPENVIANTTYPSPAQLQNFYTNDLWPGVDVGGHNLQKQITGHPTRPLTTDETIQWAAWKWGLSEDLIRSIAVTESWWIQYAAGDFTTNFSACPPGANTRVVNGQMECSQSYGIVQLKYRYHAKSMWPLHRDSTAFALDYLCAYYRMVWQGHMTWLANQTPVAGYPSYPSLRVADIWGAVGSWYSGNWYDLGAVNYITTAKSNLARRRWEVPGF